MEGEAESWSTKEVVADMKSDLVAHLNKQDAVLGSIDRKVDAKADKADLVNLTTEVRIGFDGHGNRLTVLEEHRLETLASKKFRNRAWAVAGTAAGVAAIIIGALIDSHIH